MGGLGVWSGGEVRLGGQGGCERRIEVLGKFTKKNSGGGGGGLGGVRRGGGQVGVGLVGGVRVGVNAMLGVGDDVGYGECELRIEGIVQCTKRYCTILRK